MRLKEPLKRLNTQWFKKTLRGWMILDTSCRLFSIILVKQMILSLSRKRRDYCLIWKNGVELRSKYGTKNQKLIGSSWEILTISFSMIC